MMATLVLLSKRRKSTRYLNLGRTTKWGWAFLGNIADGTCSRKVCAARGSTIQAAEQPVGSSFVAGLCSPGLPQYEEDSRNSHKQ